MVYSCVLKAHGIKKKHASDVPDLRFRKIMNFPKFGPKVDPYQISIFDLSAFPNLFWFNLTSDEQYMFIKNR
jgi:hypothetical protein